MGWHGMAWLPISGRPCGRKMDLTVHIYLEFLSLRKAENSRLVTLLILRRETRMSWKMSRMRGPWETESI